MDYSKELTEMRNNMHCNIVQEATVVNCVKGNSGDGVLLLKKPVDIGSCVVQSVCCETGFLISEEDKIVRYQDLTIEQLSVLHRQIFETKNYTFTLNSQLV
jgi:hypothetical protein